MEKPVALGADHGGFALKEAVRAHLDERGVPYVDYGTHSEASVDYPDMAVPPCEAVVRGECACALLFCGTGVGISMAANKLDGSAPAAAATLSAPNTHACTTTPTPFVWAGALSARALPANWWTCFWTPPSKAAAMRAASPRYPRWSSADIHAEPSRKAEHKGD